MSRIIIKNLPKTISEKKLRELFEEKGSITDLQLKYNKAGVFRQFAFVGYKTEDEAKEAQKHFNNTFIFTSKVQVEMCSNLNDPNKPKAWKELLEEKAAKIKLKQINESPTKEEKKKKDKASKLDDVPEELKKDPKFKEFMAIHENRKSKPIWADDIDAGEENDNSEISGEDDDGYGTSHKGESELSAPGELIEQEEHKTKSKKVIPENAEKSSESNDTEKASDKKVKIYDYAYTVKLRNLPYSCKKKQIKEFFHPLKIASLRVPPKNKGFSYVSFKTEKDLNKALIKHRGYLGGRRVDVIKYTKKEMFGNEKHNKQAGEKVDMELLAETGRIYIRNLCFGVTESDLEQLFSNYGPLGELYLPMDRMTKKAQGFAFVSYLFAEHAVKAFTELDGTIFQGRLLHLIPAQPKKEMPIDEEDANFKKKKEAKMKALSGSSHNWNMLFLGMNAVADVIAEKYNVEKSKLLSGEGEENVAVRMALAETNLVLETRKFLIENGVQIDAFSQAAAERSKTVIIVKHLPAKSTSEELNELFSKYGSILRIVMPPSGLVALVEFQDPTEAKEAFKKLAYRRFHHLPLYLEWAPVGGLKDPPPKVAEKESVEEEEEEKKATEINESITDEENRDELPSQGTTVFVKNLNFSTTDESFKKHFKNCGPILSAEIAKKKDLKTGKLLSMGFGFIQFKTKESALKAVKNFQLSKLDDHSLEVKLSNRATVPSATTKKKKYEVTKQLSSKILVRNVPFQAAEKDVRELFCQFGSLRFVRLPKKMGNDGGHRGFAFVEFLTKGDAKRAFDALCHSTHLFGRRLVLEWSNPESEDINEIRKKTARDFAESEPKKKLKKTKLNEDIALASARQLNEEELE